MAYYDAGLSKLEAVGEILYSEAGKWIRMITYSLTGILDACVTIEQPRPEGALRIKIRQLSSWKLKAHILYAPDGPHLTDWSCFSPPISAYLQLLQNPPDQSN